MIVFIKLVIKSKLFFHVHSEKLSETCGLNKKITDLFSEDNKSSVLFCLNVQVFNQRLPQLKQLQKQSACEVDLKLCYKCTSMLFHSTPLNHSSSRTV